MREILVIDDEKPTLSMFSLYLEAYGHNVITAENGECGLELFKQRKPQIVITDIKMPGMDGLEVLRCIKEISPLTEVIVITGHGDIELALKALNLNATDFIDKPISREALEAALSRADERLAAAANKTDEIGVRQVNGVSVLEIHGNVTSRSEPFLVDAFKEASGKDGLQKLILHFDDAASINGAGIAVLTQLLMESEKRGQPIALAGPSDNFRKVFEIVGITRIVKIYDTVHAALSGLQ